MPVEETAKTVEESLKKDVKIERLCRECYVLGRRFVMPKEKRIPVTEVFYTPVSQASEDTFNIAFVGVN